MDIEKVVKLAVELLEELGSVEIDYTIRHKHKQETIDPKIIIERIGYESQGLYLRKKDAAKFLGISTQTVYRLVNGIQEEIKKGRYSKYSIAGSLVNKAVLIDYVKYRDMLSVPHAKYVPPYAEDEAMRVVGAKDR